MKKKKLQCSVPALLLAGVLCLTLAACGAKQSSDIQIHPCQQVTGTFFRGKTAILVFLHHRISFTRNRQKLAQEKYIWLRLPENANYLLQTLNSYF